MGTLQGFHFCERQKEPLENMYLYIYLHDVMMGISYYTDNWATIMWV